MNRRRGLTATLCAIALSSTVGAALTAPIWTPSTPAYATTSTSSTNVNSVNVIAKLQPGVDIEAESKRLGLLSYRAVLRSRGIYRLVVPLTERELLSTDPKRSVIGRLSSDTAFRYVEGDDVHGPVSQRVYASTAASGARPGIFLNLPTGIAAPASSVTVTAKLRPGTDIAATSARLGLLGYRTALWTRGIFELVVPLQGREAQDKDAARKVIERLKKDQAFAWVEGHETQGPGDERFHAWIDGTSEYVGSNQNLWLAQPAANDIGLVQAHQRSLGEGVTVAVLDTGVYAAHPSLGGRVVGGYDYVDDDVNPDDPANGVDDDRDGRVDEAAGHGTFVTGVVTLVAPKSRIWVARVLNSDGQGSAPIVAEAIHDATTAGVGVINMSFGMGSKINSPALAAAIKEAKDAGVVLVAAAGNDASRSPFFPAADSGVISVGAARTGTRQLSSFSNFGKWVDVVAPGEYIVSTTPGGFSTWSGTSAAAPFVSGQAALLRSVAPREKGTKILEFIRTTSRTLDRPAVLAAGGGLIDLAASLDRVK